MHETRARQLPQSVLGVAIAFFLCAAAVAAAPVTDPAARQIQSFYAALLEAMKQGKAGIQARYRLLTPAVENTFDLPAMAQLSVGPAWMTMSEMERKAIIDAFERLTIASYARSFSSYGGEQFVVDPAVKERNGDKIVESKLIGSDKQVTLFNYRMRMAEGKWKVIDVYLNGYASQLALRRSDFASTIASSGGPGLVKKINELADRQMTGT